MRACLAQLAPAGGVPANVERAAQLVKTQRAADLIVFPELFLCGYDLARAAERAIGPDDELLAPLRAAAAATATVVLAGFAERRAGAVANSLLCIDERGATAALYRKLALFGGEVGVFAPGESVCVVDVAGTAVGVMLCFDVEFPEIARALASAGADVIVTASANMAPYFDDHLLATRARALDNRRPHLYVNRVGGEAGLRFVGGTRHIAADGTVVDEIGGDGEGTLTASVGRAAVPDRVDYVNLARRLPVRISW
ncbi:MAG TPA: nitrilase-related carbon-nitrogen hydrolase [Solirubrobacteraceae bacterium]|nr:nitrilase-related carbon-nitrogen hydrolase [Solirubrobacteraceae bacterium]